MFATRHKPSSSPLVVRGLSISSQNGSCIKMIFAFRLCNMLFDESIQMKHLLHMYIGLIPVGVAGEYMVKLVAACPKVSISNFTEQLTYLALLNVWCGGLSGAQSLALASCIREKRDLVSLLLQLSPSTRSIQSQS
jgi:hypothetical protein